MKDDIRKETCCIVRKDGEFLVGTVLWSEDLRWSIYRHDAWRTRKKERAEEVARMTGGVVMLFNPVAGQMKVL